MSYKFDAVLAEALSRVDAGEDVAACLRAYPARSAELAPLLDVAVLARQAFAYVEPPSDTALAANRRRLLAAAAAAPVLPAWRRWLDALVALPAPVRGLAAAVAVLVLVLVLSAGAGSVSADSLPGDALYPVKRAAEGVHLALTLDPRERLRLDQRLSERRRQEAVRVITSRRRAEWSFRGRLERVEGDGWTVGQVRVELDPQAALEVPAPGALVQVSVAAPGDGRLVVRAISILATPQVPPAPAVPATGTPLAAPVDATTTALPNPTGTPTGAPSSTPTAGGLTGGARLDASPSPTGEGRPWLATPGALETRAARWPTPGPGTPGPGRFVRLTPGPDVVRTVMPPVFPNFTPPPGWRLTPAAERTRPAVATLQARMTAQPMRTPAAPSGQPATTRQPDATHAPEATGAPPAEATHEPSQPQAGGHTPQVPVRPHATRRP